MSKNDHIFEAYHVGIILALVGGFFDAYTYICRGHVFANAQTGNIVLVGIELKQGNLSGCFYHLIPVIAFMVGVLIIEFLKFKFAKNPSVHWHQLSILCEIIIAAIVGFIPSGKYDTLANILISLTCAMQVEAFRKVNGNPFATTMCTGNLRSGTDNLFAFLSSKDTYFLKISLQYYVIILFFMIGAILGAFFTSLLSVMAVFVTEIGLIAVLIILIIGNRKAG